MRSTSTQQVIQRLGTARGLPASLISDHLARLPESYFAKHGPSAVIQHLELIQHLGSERHCQLVAERQEDGYLVTVAALDQLGAFSLIAGLLAVWGLSIQQGEAFTYAPPALPLGVRRPPAHYLRRYFVDTFGVRPTDPSQPIDWTRLRDELEELLTLAAQGQMAEARRRLNVRVVELLRRATATLPPELAPLEVKVSNDQSPEYTVLDITGEDTVAFLYEFTNALAMRGIYLGRLAINTVGTKVHDRLYVADTQGKKLTSRRRLADVTLAAVLLKHFTHLLPRAADPELALANFDQFIDQVFAPEGEEHSSFN
ncbi:MAG: hypothetical protein HY335_06140, partial [Deinococcus sp.]|nr:hypothetical protein [Deinococcus sp.]